MTVTDPLVAIQVLRSAALKAATHSDELKSLLDRIQYIHDFLQDGKLGTGKPIAPAGYNAAMITVTRLLQDTYRVTRLVLKGSLTGILGDGPHIAAELKRLSEETAQYIGTRALRKVDIQIAPTPSFEPVLGPPLTERELTEKMEAVMIEEAVTQIEALDQTFSNISFAKAQGDVRLDEQAQNRKGFHAILERANPGQGPGTAGWSITKGVDLHGLVKGGSRGFPLKLKGLRKVGARRREGHTVTLELPGNADLDDVVSAITEAGYDAPKHFLERDFINIRVTDGDSVYDGTAPGSLQINKDEPLLWWMNKYHEYHGITRPLPLCTEVQWTRDTLRVDNLSVRCHRTLRVPDRVGPSKLPPSLGTFEFYPVSQLGPRVPDMIKRRGGFIMPMFRREALWMSFGASENHPAVRVSVGGVNAISGESASSVQPLKGETQQDYVVAGRQPWLDGIATAPGVVRQFVVTDLNEGYTVEEQVTGEAKVGGIQLDIYPRRKRPDGKFVWSRPSNTLPHEPMPQRYSSPLDMTSTPAELQGVVGQYVAFVRPSPPLDRESASWNLATQSRLVSPTPSMTVAYKVSSSYLSDDSVGSSDCDEDDGSDDSGLWSRPDGQARGSIGATAPRGKPRARSAVLGIAAGGKIEQRIYTDLDSTRVYDEQLGRRVYIHIVTPELWEDLTGILPPATKVNREAYLQHGIPWFSLYDDYAQAIDHTSSVLSKVISVLGIDEAKTKAKGTPGGYEGGTVVNPTKPPPCFRHPQATSSCVFRPCGHTVCAPCLGTAILEGSKCSCGTAVTKFVGMKRPLPKFSLDSTNDGKGDNDLQWDVTEIEQLASNAYTSGTVRVIHLKRDNVGPLMQKGRVPSSQ